MLAYLKKEFSFTNLRTTLGIVVGLALLFVALFYFPFLFLVFGVVYVFYLIIKALE